MLVLQGTGLGGGVVVGRAMVLESRLMDVPRYRIEFAARPAEVARLRAAIDGVRQELEQIGAQLAPDAPSEAHALLSVHAMILDDPALVAQACVAIEAHGHNAEWAFASRAEHLVAQFDQIEDAYLRERGRDVTQVADRVLKGLAGSGRAARSRPSADEVPWIVVAHDISPADMLQFKHAGGFALDLGGTVSHTAILARSMAVPAGVGLGCASQVVRDDDWLVLDGDQGLLIVAPEATVLDDYRQRMAQTALERKQLERLIHVPTVTLEGTPIDLQINIEEPSEAEQAAALGVSGVGLFRTEFLFMNRAELPSEDEQYEAYRTAVQALAGRPLTIRTIDIGADKGWLGCASPYEGGAAPNPALGQRAIRFSLAVPEVFLTQLRAVLRASEHGPVRVLLPLLAHGHEVTQALHWLAVAREQVTAERSRALPPMVVGGMIEVPAAALTVGYFARQLDFLSVGTNDLVQYTLAIDRSDHTVAALYDPFHPAVLALVARILKVCHRLNKPVAVCGEMAGDCAATRLLLGMGLRSFSMHSASVLRVKQEIVQADVAEMTRRVARLLKTEDPLRLQRGLLRLRR